MKSSPDGKDEKEGRIARHSRLAREAWAKPRSVLTRTKEWLVRLWITKGGGFYGLGYVITFISLEASSLSGDVVGSDNISDFITSQFIGFIIRFSVESFLNALSAVIWPVLLLQWPNGLGIVTLIAAYAGYRLLLDPFFENQIPELREAREARQARKAKAESNRAGSPGDRS
ncbi:MAG: hypothetical protein PVH89_11825 [Gammaproteobacteria bacterium]|jgi:hypothetical protein